MSSSPDLFSFAGEPAPVGNHAHYPNEPGWKSRETSRRAAEDIKPAQKTIQESVLDALSQRPMASFELATHLGRSYRSVQPRTSELAAKCKIFDSGARRTDPETGKDVIVWRLA